MTGGVKKLSGAQLAEQDQFEATFEAEMLGGHGRPAKVTVRLSKGDAARYTKPQMAAFLAVLSRWARQLADDGYVIRAEPEAGPGTAKWVAYKE